MTGHTDPDSFLPLSEAVFEILLSLADEERHGYGIMVEVAERTGKRVRIGPGTLYGAIKRLREQGMVEPVDETDSDPTDERRRHYRLTDLGRRVAILESRRIERLLGAARTKGLVPRAEGAE